jgi:hypothetical protein
MTIIIAIKAAAAEAFFVLDKKDKVVRNLF